MMHGTDAIYDEIIQQIELEKGDIIDVSSDMLGFAVQFRKLRRLFEPNVLIDALQDKVGADGTILIRTWNWNFCKGEPFDYKQTPSQVGSLGDVALARADFKRTVHPIYSFAVWGKHKDALCQMNNHSAWGADSPFGFMTDHHGKQLMLGSTMCNSLTYVHYVEEQLGVHYRYLKDFTAPYIDEEGIEEIRTYAMNVRKLELNIKMISENFADVFYQTGVLKTNFYHQIPISTVKFAEAYPIIEEDIVHNHSRTFCVFDGQ